MGSDGATSRVCVVHRLGARYDSHDPDDGHTFETTIAEGHLQLRDFFSRLEGTVHAVYVLKSPAKSMSPKQVRK